MPRGQYARKPVARPAMRPEVREEAPRPESVRSDRRDAKARAAAIMEGDILEETVDQFNIDHVNRDPEWTYEWKRMSTVGKEDPSYEAHLARMGWEPVPAERHPELMPKGTTGPVTREGMMLMERPKIVTDRIKERDRRAAKAPLHQLRETLEGDQKIKFDRSNKGESLVKVKQSWTAPVPEE